MLMLVEQKCYQNIFVMRLDDYKAAVIAKHVVYVLN